MEQTKPGRSRSGVVVLLSVLLVASACSSGGRPEPVVAPSEARISLGFRAAGDVGSLIPGRAVQLSASAYSASPLTTMEIWADGELAGTLDPGGATSYTGTFGWVPDGVGVHAVTIRVVDRDGGSATAGPIWTRVFDPAGGSGSAGSSPTTDGPAVTVSDCVATIEPESGGASVFIAGFGGAFDLVGSGPVEVAMGGSPLIAYTEIEGRVSAPVLIPEQDVCRRRGWSGNLDFDGGILANPTGADGAYLYVSYEEGIWRRVPEKNQTFVGPGLTGGFDFGPLLSPPAGSPVAIEAWGWRNGELVALGAGSWEPTAAKGSPTDISLGGLTGPVIASTGLDWILFNGTPVRQGTICTYEPTSRDGTIATLAIFCTNGPTGSIPTTFRWSSAWGTHGVLQVSALPPPSGSSLAYPGLLSMQSVPAAAGGSVEFSVDFDRILDPPPSVATEPDPSQLTYQAIAGLLPGSEPQRADFSPPFFQTAAGESLGERRPLPSDVLYLRVVPMDGLQPLPGASNTVVIDLVHEAPPPEPVVFEIPDLTMQVEMAPPTVPNPSYSRCVRVVENPFGADNPTPEETPLWNALHPTAYPLGLSPFGYSEAAYDSTADRAFVYENGVEVHQGLVPGSTVCATRVAPPEKDWLDYIGDAVGFLADTWDLYSMIYEKLKATIADALVIATACEQWLDEEDCQAMASTAVVIGLTALGAPPTIPKFGELVEGAKGDLANWVVTESGVCEDIPFRQECEDLAEDMIEAMLDEIQIAASEAATTAAVSGTQWDLTLHPGIVVIPEPAGTLAPATFDITIRRAPGEPSADFPSSCHIAASAGGTRDHYEWQNYHEDRWEAGPVGGLVMQSKAIDVDLTDMAPGDTKRVVIVLDKLAEWYLPGQWPNQSGVPWNVDPSSWIFLAADDAVLHLAVATDCGLGRTESFPREARFPEPWEIPYP